MSVLLYYYSVLARRRSFALVLGGVNNRQLQSIYLLWQVFGFLLERRAREIENPLWFHARVRVLPTTPTYVRNDQWVRVKAVFWLFIFIALRGGTHWAAGCFSIVAEQAVEALGY